MPKTIPLLLIILFCSCLPLASGQEVSIKELESFSQSDRLLILAPHPDDETIACAGVIQQAVKIGAQVRVVYLTSGDHNEIAFIVYEKYLALRAAEFIHLGEVRRSEAIKAMEFLGVPKEKLTFLGYPDFGTFAMFSQYWGGAKPYRSLLTRISSVPYKGSPSYGAPYKPENILLDLKKILLEYRPTKIFVSHPADVNADHKALYLYLQIALSDLGKKLGAQPKVYPYLVHAYGWPLPRHYHPELVLLPPDSFKDSGIDWLWYSLSGEEIEKKHQAILCYRSQTSSSAFYLLSFCRKDELFGNYPETEVTVSGLNPYAVKSKKGAFFDPAALKAHLVSLFDTSLQAEDEEGYDPEEVRQGVIYNADGENFFITINKAEDNARQRLLSWVYLFGYKRIIPFSQMPKIRIFTKYNTFRIFNGKEQIFPEDFQVQLTEEQLILKVPLAVLGGPDYVLVSTRAYTGSLPYYRQGFEKIDLTRRK